MTTIDPRTTAADIMTDYARDVGRLDIAAYIGQKYDNPDATSADIDAVADLIAKTGIDLLWPDGTKNTELDAARVEIDRLRAELDQMRAVAEAAKYEYGDMWCLDRECDHDTESDDATCPMVETRYATAAEILAVQALLMSTDGDALNDAEEIPVGEIRRVLGEAREAVAS